jgi:predicted transcriptional regulator
LKEELNKCILLCANCHREEHHIDIDVRILEEVKTLKKNIVKNCFNCNKEFKGYKSKYCSTECSHESQRKTDWPTSEELSNMLEYKTISEIARDFNVSWHTVKRWINKVL